MTFHLPVVQSTRVGGASSRGSHRLAQIFECPRAWYLRWVRGLVPLIERRIYFVEGNLCHLLLAYHHAGRMEHPPSQFAPATLPAQVAKAGARHPEAIALAYDFIAAYRARREGDRWTPLGVEVEFAASIREIRALHGQTDPIDVDDEVLSVRIDLVALINSLIWLVDYKGTSKGYGDHLPRWHEDGEYATRWQFHLQILVVQAALARAAAAGQQMPQLGGVIVQRFKRKPPFDVDANVAPFNAAMNRAAVQSAIKAVRAERELVQEIVGAAARGENMETWVPDGHLWNCWDGFGPCDYRPLCMTADEGAWLAVKNAEYKQAEE